MVASCAYEIPSYDSTCYLCPGNVRPLSGKCNETYSSTYVFENDEPCFSVDVCDFFLYRMGWTFHTRNTCRPYTGWTWNFMVGYTYKAGVYTLCQRSVQMHSSISFFLVYMLSHTLLLRHYKISVANTFDQADVSPLVLAFLLTYRPLKSITLRQVNFIVAHLQVGVAKLWRILHSTTPI